MNRLTKPSIQTVRGIAGIDVALSAASSMPLRSRSEEKPRQEEMNPSGFQAMNTSSPLWALRVAKLEFPVR